MNNFFAELKKGAFPGLIFLFMFLPSTAFATWSIMILDEETKEIGIAGASCSYLVYGIGGFVPAEGAVIAQAMSNMEAKEKALGMIRRGFSQKEIMAAITDPEFDRSFPNQQYAILTFTEFDEPQTFSGENISKVNGALTAPGVSVQGNTLASEEVLKAAFNAATTGENLPAQLMLALSEGAKEGGDVRCGEQKATSAFITIVKPGDADSDKYLNLVVYGLDRGSDNAVDKLSEIYLNWKNNFNHNENARIVCWQKMPGKPESYACE